MDTFPREPPSTRKEKKDHDGQVRKFEPHGVGVQISRRVHPEVSPEGCYAVS